MATSEGETPIEVAVRLKNKDVFKVFMEHIAAMEDGDYDVPLILGDVETVDPDEAAAEEEDDGDENKSGPPRLNRRWTHTSRGHTRSADRVEKRIHSVETSSKQGRKKRTRRRK